MPFYGAVPAPFLGGDRGAVDAGGLSGRPGGVRGGALGRPGVPVGADILAPPALHRRGGGGEAQSRARQPQATPAGGGEGGTDRRSLHQGPGGTLPAASARQGTTLYLCLEDSVLRIQNRLFEITEDAPDSVHFCTECAPIGQGLEEQLNTFLTAHPDTVLVIIDTLQMIRPVHDATYANDYRDLSVLKRLADKHGLAILLVHHLRKEKAEDVFHRISGTTAISGAVDSSFTLVEEQRGSGRAKLTCIGRDIEYRELELERNGDNVWELLSDSRTQPELLEGRIVVLLSEFLKNQREFIGTPTELSQRIDPDGQEGITSKKVSRLILQSVEALRRNGISAVIRRSNGKRIIQLRRADSDDMEGAKGIVPIDPVSVHQ